MNGDTSDCVAPPLPSSSSLISACGDFDAGPTAWPYVLVATTVADGSASQAAQTFTMNVTSLPAGGANFRVYKTNINGGAVFGNPQVMVVGQNTITVTAVAFDRAVKFQFSSGDVEFDALSLNGVASSCVGATTCTEDSPTGLFTSDVIHNRATINWDNMNSTLCFVDQYRIQYRESGTTSWSQKTMSGPVGSCNYASQKTDKLILNLTANTTYEYQMKAWYCGGGASSWSGIETFTTLDNCPNVGNLAVYGATPTKATFTWDGSNGVYSFVRLKARVDSISNPTGADFFQIGGAGVAYGTNTKNKNGLTPGETYRGQARTYCNPNGGPWKSLSWTPLVYWTQPTQRIEGGEAISHLDVYPNPSKDVFNITFTSERVQDLRVRVLNVVGEEIIKEELQQYIGEYTKQINLKDNAKGIYFLEIETNDGIINKKLILQ